MRNNNEIVKTNASKVVANYNENCLIQKPHKFFDDSGYFKSYDFMIEILKRLKIIYIEKIGFYMFTECYWKYVEEGYISQILHLSLGKLSKPRYVSETMKSIKNQVYKPLDVLNSNRNRIVLKNGTLDISNWITPKFYNNQYFIEDYSTIYLNYDFTPEASYLEFEKYINSTFEGQPDDIKTLQEMFGYCLTTSTKFEKIFILYGQGGSGKSILIDALKTFVTEANYSSIPMSLLDKSFLRAGLKDKILNFATEESHKGIKDTVVAWIKAISSGDPIEAQFKNRDTFNFNPFCKLVFAMNDLPAIENFDEALKRRMIIINFNKLFRGTERDLELKEGKLHKEMDGILQWALIGLKRLAENKDFTCSQQAIDAVDNYRLESNHAERYADTFLEKGNDGSYLIIRDVYNKYLKYCEEGKDKPFKSSEFSKIIKRKFMISEGRKQKKITDKSGKVNVEDVFEGLVYKDFSKVIELKKSS